MQHRWPEIRAAFGAPRVGFPAAEAQEVLDSSELRDALVADLEALAETPAELIDSGSMLHIIGMMLLAQMRDRRLATPLIKLTSGNEDEVESLWGDFLTEEWGTAAAAVCSANELKAFLENEAHAPWARVMVTRALSVQVYEGDLDRAQTVDYAIVLCERYLPGLLDAQEGHPNDLIIDLLADIVGDFGEAERHLPVLEKWFELGVLDLRHAGPDWYRKELLTPYEDRRLKAMGRFERYPRDVIALMSRWYCYSEEWHRDEMKAAAEEESVLWSSDSGTFMRDTIKVGRNAPCPCGSGKKFKKCCGA